MRSDMQVGSAVSESPLVRRAAAPDARRRGQQLISAGIGHRRHPARAVHVESARAGRLRPLDCRDLDVEHHSGYWLRVVLERHPRSSGRPGRQRGRQRRLRTVRCKRLFAGRGGRLPHFRLRWDVVGQLSAPAASRAQDRHPGLLVGWRQPLRRPGKRIRFLRPRRAAPVQVAQPYRQPYLHRLGGWGRRRTH